jgi:flagellar biosynthesis anti-sigma factor FlgM
MKLPKVGAETTAASIGSTRSNGVDKTSIGKNKANALEDVKVLSKNGDSSKVQLSERAQLMSRAKEIASKTSVDNSEKVARLQKMIDEGKYSVDSAAVADRMVDTHMEFPD